MKINLRNKLTVSVLLSLSMNAHAMNYNYELSDEQTWSDVGSTTSSSQYVTVRAYVPGSNTINYTTVPVYTSTYSSTANALGDVVGSVSNIYGTSPAWVDPYNAAKYSIMYPSYNVMRTRLTAVNDDRLAVGHYIKVGGTSTSFIYDLIYKQYTPLSKPIGVSDSISDINNAGQFIGSYSDYNATLSYTYDCLNGVQDFIIPDASSTTAVRIDDSGNVYGRVYGLDDTMTYFIARPDEQLDTSSCSLVARDDVAEPIVFSEQSSFEMSGDTAQLVKIGDFDHGGADDIFIYHEMGKYILYIGEDGFKSKIKNFADWNTVETVTGVTSATQWDFNNDGLMDKLTSNSLFLARDVDSFYYVPQALPVGTRAAYGDFNGDGLMDAASFSGAYVSVAYQADQLVSEPIVVEPDPLIVDPIVTDPVVEPVIETSGNVPLVEENAETVELSDTIVELGSNNVLLSSGDTLWFNSDSIIKYNNASQFEVDQLLEFKAWQNSDGALIGIKVEVVDVE